MLLTKNVIATIKDWHLSEFTKRKLERNGFILISQKDDLTVERLKSIQPQYVFFPHWSWIVPSEITENFECVCFHSSDVPYGRGGSPIQNLIIRGHTETKITALKMVQELDAGPVYLKQDLSLLGRAQDIFESSARIIFDMIEWIVTHNPIPQPQVGEPIVFSRRVGTDNELPKEGSLDHLYNHIRMLDADSYPKPYIDYGDYKLEFDHAKLSEDYLTATVRIKRKEI